MILPKQIRSQKGIWSKVFNIPWGKQIAEGTLANKTLRTAFVMQKHGIVLLAFHNASSYWIKYSSEPSPLHSTQFNSIQFKEFKVNGRVSETLHPF